MRLPLYKAVLPAALIGCALLFMGVSGQAASRPDTRGTQSGSDTAAQTPPPPTATLQVSGTVTEFTISADHADVQSALKLVFDQAGKQFVLGNDVLGQVTLRLERQPLATVLDALCAQVFLRYQVSPAGIYQFSRNTEALHTFILRQSTLNDALLQRMRSLGLNVLNLLPTGPAGPLGFPGNPRLGGGVGGLAEGSKPAPNTFRKVGGVQVQENNPSESTPDKTRRADMAPNLRASLGQNGFLFSPQSQIAPGAQIIVQQGLVSVHTSPDHPIALTDLLQELSRQTHIPILIDPQVPSGIKFRFAGNLTARSLTEWLERLAPVARLQWYWVGNQVFVTTSPEFAIFYGSSDVPRATFGMPAQASQNQQRGTAAARSGAPQKSEPNK